MDVIVEEKGSYQREIKITLPIETVDNTFSKVYSEFGKKAKVPVQKFVIRSDLRCGSTIGPVTAANLGIRAVDIGNPMLSMHSIREMAGSKDQESLIRVFKEFFKPE